MAKGIV